MLKKLYQTIIQIIHKGYVAWFLAACVILALFCFWKLDAKYVDSWDEARHGVNAYEMIQNQNYIQHTYNYEVDDWNLKPSMSYWGILLGFGIFGYSVLGLRFYAALCYLITGIVTGLFVGKRSKVGGILVMGFFCANTLPLQAHLARAGDADSLYLMLFTFAMLAMLNIQKNHNNLYICGLCFSLAFLTKSWHAGMIAVIGGLYLLVTGELWKIRFKEWGIFLISIFAPLLLWFGWRYTADGFFFLKQMIQVDLLARTGTENFEGHQFPFSFYWDSVLTNETYIYPWILVICGLGLIAGLFWMFWTWMKNRSLAESQKQDLQDVQDKQNGYLILGLLLWFGIVFLGFSLIGTKLIWYCYPALVPLFAGAALFVGKMLEWNSEDKVNLVSHGKKWITEYLLPGIQILVTAACIVLVVHFMKFTYDTVIRSAQGDGFQNFLQLSADQDSSYAGYDAYIQVPGEHPEQLGDWDQNRLFVAEISGNFRCKDGGVEGFLNGGDKSVLYIDRNQYVLYQEELTGYTTLFLEEGYPYVLMGKE